MELYHSWSSKKQPVVALSAVEAEYIAAAQASCQVSSSKLTNYYNVR